MFNHIISIFFYEIKDTETMKIGTKGHYAVGAMVELARKTSLNRPLALRALVVDQNISVNYLELLFVKLKKQGLVSSVRGAQGGYLLTRDPSHISILEIVMAVGEGVRVNRCKNATTSSYCFDQKIKCTLHAMWEGLGERIHDYLNNISLQDLVNGKPFQGTSTLKVFNEHPTYIINNAKPS